MRFGEWGIRGGGGGEVDKLLVDPFPPQTNESHCTG